MGVGVCVGWTVCCCCSISIPVHLLSSAAQLSISNGTTLAEEPATIPQSHRKYTKSGGKKAEHQEESHFFTCKSVCRLEMLVCCMFVDQHAHHGPRFVFLNPGLLRSKCRMTNFKNVFIKHETHIFFSAYKDAIKLVLLNWNLIFERFLVPNEPELECDTNTAL